MPQDRHYPPTNRFRPPIATTPRRQPPSDSTNTIIIFLLVILFFLFFFFFFLSTSSSHAPKIIIKPTPIKVKSNWNSFIVFLFLFAIIAGILAQNNDPPSTPNVTNRVNNRTSETNRNQEVQVNDDLRRRSSSNTNLRQNPLPENRDNNNSRRREERKENNHRSEPVSGDIRHRSHRIDVRKVVPNIPEIIAQRRQSPIRVRSPPPPPPPRAPAPAPPVSGESRRRRTSRNLGLNQTVKVTNQNIRSHEYSQIPPPRRPPPPPPPAIKQQSNRTNPIQPPIPPPQPSDLRQRPASKHKPPLPTKSSNYHHTRDDFLSGSSHSQSSSSSSIPPPPPLPPFKLPARKFESHGDYNLRLLSVHSSDFSSPDRDDDLRSTIIDGGDSFGPSPISSTSSSPSINTKADRFISKNRDEWRTEKEERKWARANR